MRIIVIIISFITFLTFINNRAYAIDKVCAGKYEKKITTNSNQKERFQYSNVISTENETKIEHYSIYPCSHLKSIVPSLQKQIFAYQQTFFDNHTTEIKDNPPNFI